MNECTCDPKYCYVVSYAVGDIRCSCYCGCPAHVITCKERLKNHGLIIDRRCFLWNTHLNHVADCGCHDVMKSITDRRRAHPLDAPMADKPVSIEKPLPAKPISIEKPLPADKPTGVSSEVAIDPRLADLLAPVVLEEITAGNIAVYLEFTGGVPKARKPFIMYSVGYEDHGVLGCDEVLTLMVRAGAELTAIAPMAISTKEAIKYFSISDAEVIHDGAGVVLAEGQRWTGAFVKPPKGLKRSFINPR